MCTRVRFCGETGYFDPRYFYYREHGRHGGRRGEENKRGLLGNSLILTGLRSTMLKGSQRDSLELDDEYEGLCFPGAASRWAAWLVYKQNRRSGVPGRVWRQALNEK